MNQEFLEKLKRLAGNSNLREQEPMSRHTTFRVGGPAELFMQPAMEKLPDILQLCQRYEIPYYIIGNGSNLLVGDKGISGLVIELLAPGEDIRTEGEQVTAGAGVLLSRIANRAADEGLCGMEFASGIPGTLGGAVVMNAGAYDREMKDIITSVTVLDASGNQKTLEPKELEFGYRKSCILGKGYIVTQAVLTLSCGKREEILSKMKELQSRRQEKQPLEYPSAGSAFKRPEGYYAGKLIMEAGLRGFQIGGAQVSEKHCGFVINKGQATAKDICELMQEVSRRVEAQFGVVLEPEVKMIGNF